MGTTKQEVQVKATNTVAVYGDSWEADTDIVEAKDIRIPRALLMQSTSEMVGQRKAQLGDIVNSVTMQKLGDEASPLKVVPITTYKTWTIEVLKNAKFEWETQEAYTLSNSTRSKDIYKYTCKDGQTRDARAVEVINLLCFLESDLGKPEALPYVIAFRMTSFQCGQQILTERRNAKSANRPFASYVLELKPSFTKNEKGQFFKFTVGAKSNNEKFSDNQAILKGWFDTFQAGAMKVDEEAKETSSGLKDVKATSEEY